MSKELKLWNGRSPIYHGKFGNGYVFVAAYSQKQAAELISKALAHCSTTEIRTYFNQGSWGNTMAGIEPTEPCVYAVGKEHGAIPERVI